MVAVHEAVLSSHETWGYDFSLNNMLTLTSNRSHSPEHFNIYIYTIYTIYIEVNLETCFKFVPCPVYLTNLFSCIYFSSSPGHQAVSLDRYSVVEAIHPNCLSKKHRCQLSQLQHSSLPTSKSNPFDPLNKNPALKRFFF